MNQTTQKDAVRTAVKTHMSASPHLRNRLTTGKVMLQVLLSLLPAAVVGVCANGFHAFLVIAVCMLSAVATEALFCLVTRKPSTVSDGSAAVTGLLLALCLPASVPLYVPVLGSVFAILVVKCLFGGLGKNFMNPALAARCFLLISFGSVMTRYTVDGVSCATPLADLAAGRPVDIMQAFLGFSNDVIGGSVAGMLIGGIYLWLVGGITLHIPLSVLASFTLFVGLFGGQGFDPAYLLAHLCSGGIVMGAVFMATDPVTSPTNAFGHVVYGCIIGILSGIFRVFGSATDSVSYAIITANLVVPIIDEYCIPRPYGLRNGAQEGKKKRPVLPKEAVILGVITLIAGICLSGVYAVTKEPIARQQQAASLASYREVCPDAESFAYDDDLSAAVEALGGGVYGTSFGKAYITEAVVGSAGDRIVGYVISVTSGDGVEGNITLSVGISADGTVTGIAFTELNETPGLGSLCGEPAFKDQFLGVRTDWFALSGSGMVIDGASAATGTADTASGATGTADAASGATGTADTASGATGTADTASGATGTADTASGATGTADTASGATGTADAETGATASSDSVESVTVMTGSSTEIDGVSGATKSSRAVVNAINAALDFFRTYKKGGM